jgi:hypothetical protein
LPIIHNHWRSHRLNAALMSGPESSRSSQFKATPNIADAKGNLILQLYFSEFREICEDPGLKAPYSELIFRGLKPPAPSANAICNCSTKSDSR